MIQIRPLVADDGWRRLYPFVSDLRLGGCGGGDTSMRDMQEWWLRKNIVGNLCRFDVHTSSLMIGDMLREFKQTSGILNSTDVRGSSWSVKYDLQQVTSNPVGSRHVLFQFSNEHLQDVIYLNLRL